MTIDAWKLTLTAPEQALVDKLLAANPEVNALVDTYVNGAVIGNEVWIEYDQTKTTRSTIQNPNCNMLP